MMHESNLQPSVTDRKLEKLPESSTPKVVHISHDPVIDDAIRTIISRAQYMNTIQNEPSKSSEILVNTGKEGFKMVKVLDHVKLRNGASIPFAPHDDDLIEDYIPEE